MKTDEIERRKQYLRTVAILAFWRTMRASESDVRFRMMVINGHAKISVRKYDCLYRITPAGERYAEGVSVCQ